MPTSVALHMFWLFLGLSFLLGAVTGFAVFSHGAFWYGALGQVVQGLLSIACFAMIVAAFWTYSWKLGIVDILVIFAGSNLGLSLLRYLVKTSERA